MAQNDSWLVNTAAYAALRTLGTTLQLFDVDLNMRTFGTIGEYAWRKDARRRERASANISRSFPLLTPGQVDDLGRRSMRHLLQLFGVEVLFTPRLITPGTWPKHVRFGEGVNEALEPLAGKKPAIFITGHCGNFELLGFSLAAVGYPLVALARPLDLPRINEWLLGVRQRRG
ncbi:MAG: lysophospholipid acyltransferase family protein, partial [Planctomycetota bacterium]